MTRSTWVLWLCWAYVALGAGQGCIEVSRPAPTGFDVAEETTLQDAPPQDAPPQDAPPQDAAAEEVPAEEVAVQEVAVEDMHAEDAPAEDAAVQDAAVQDAAVQDAAVQDTHTEDAPAEEVPAEDTAAPDPGPEVGPGDVTPPELPAPPDPGAPGVLASSYATHEIAFGGTTLPVAIHLPDGAGPFPVVLMDWVAAQAAGGVGPLGSKADTERLALAGHSMGGKISLLAATEDPRPLAVLGPARWTPPAARCPCPRTTTRR